MLLNFPCEVCSLMSLLMLMLGYSLSASESQCYVLGNHK